MAAEVIDGIQCPKCGKPIRQGKKIYFCESCDFENGKYCFVLWKTCLDRLSGPKISSDLLKKYIAGEKVKLEFVSKSGKKYQADTILEQGAKYYIIRLLFEEKKKENNSNAAEQEQE